MKVHLVGPESVAPAGLARLFGERGDTVAWGEDLAADADVTILRSGHPALRGLGGGLVVLDARGQAASEVGAWAAYAELCLVRDEQERQALVSDYGCEPERIFAVAADADVPAIVDQAVRDRLPPARRPPPAEDPAGAAPLPLASLAAALEALDRAADVMDRGYRVRSRIPVVGRLVVWVRRNATSHLREPYLDPALEHQVAVNRRLVAALRDMVRAQAELEERLARLETEQSSE